MHTADEEAQAFSSRMKEMGLLGVCNRYWDVDEDDLEQPVLRTAYLVYKPGRSDFMEVGSEFGLQQKYYYERQRVKLASVIEQKEWDEWHTEEFSDYLLAAPAETVIWSEVEKYLAATSYQTPSEEKAAILEMRIGRIVEAHDAIINDVQYPECLAVTGFNSNFKATLQYCVADPNLRAVRRALLLADNPDWEGRKRGSFGPGVRPIMSGEVALWHLRRYKELDSVRCNLWGLLGKKDIKLQFTGDTHALIADGFKQCRDLREQELGVMMAYASPKFNEVPALGELEVGVDLV